eukprot:TRINITY_DN2029_c0_g1_i4.p1 TRINITY_DN2029_c0_g1~~TRINITY_DN2029_c0_g1_i4.p1  ORF type:complete len:372 (+),score=79.22 TRINITY_DN2029_c0_g1_i4:324-1439(+)
MGICSGKPVDLGEYVKILVLGISGSGKSTFAKQLKLIYQKGFNHDERAIYIEILKANVIMGIRELADYIVEFEEDIDISEEHRKYVRYIRERSTMAMNLVDEEVYSKIIALWNDPGLADAWERCRSYQIQVSQLDYLMENIERIIAPDFLPNNEDIIRARQRSAGATVARFPYGKLVMEIIDVGGQAPERAKWMSIAQQDLTGIIYFASLDEFNMLSSEDITRTKMQITMSVFEKVIGDLKDTVPYFVLFLNKTDLFNEKVQTKEGYSELQQYFPEYKKFYKQNIEDEIYSGIEDPKERRCFMAANFLEEQFRALAPEDATLIVRRTCTLDTNITQDVFEEIMYEYTGYRPSRIEEETSMSVMTTTTPDRE